MKKFQLNRQNRSVFSSTLFKTLYLLCLVFIVFGCSKDDDDLITITNISLNKTTLTLPVGGMEKLVATVLPENATDQTISWKSSDNAVATVDNKGNVKGLVSGATMITATVSSKSATCVVTVSPEVIQVASISLNKQSLVLSIGSEETLIATVSPENATDKTVTWSSSDRNIATVDNTGKVKAIVEGTVQITAMAGNQTAVCVATISDSGGSQQSNRFKWALYGIKCAVKASIDYNDLGRKPTYAGLGSSVYYTANGSLDFVMVDLYYKLNINKIMRIPFRFDVGRRPAAMCFAATSSEAANTVTALRDGTYDFANDPVEILAFFGGYMGNSKFTSLTELRKIANNSNITESVYNSISFAVNCYKVVIYDKNKSGTLIGKYVGYVLDDIYIYWSIDPEDKNFGKRLTTSFP